MPPRLPPHGDDEFTGFADTHGALFAEIARHQDREWFREHRAAYDRGWHHPMAALLADLHAPLQQLYPDFALAPPHVHRIFRDVRFSADKAPLKLHVSGLIELGQPGPGSTGRMQRAVALYAQVGGDSTFAAGRYVMEGAVLARFRADLLDARRGPAVARMVAALERAGYRTTAMSALKQAPRGVDPAHPRAALLRQRGLVVVFPPISPRLLTQPALVGAVLAAARRARRLVTYLAELGERA